MKKIVLTLITIVAAISLAACTGNKEKSSTSKNGETAMSSQDKQTASTNTSSKEQTESIFTAALVEDAKQNETVDQSIRLVLNKVEAVEDPEKIIGMMKNDGVILNVTKDQFADGITEEQLKAGDTIRFTLTGLPAMSMSIPPQIVGNAVLKVEKI
jgi:outer membrane PBP1 activator LpoA protein